MPHVVLVMPDRALRLLWEHAFSVAGWRTDPADTAIDALAAAFNAEADAIVVALTDAISAEIGRETLGELEKDSELSAIPRFALAVDGPGADVPGVRVFPQPCDPFWLICEADAALGRETPRGLGRRPFSESDTDVMVHAWWWTLAAGDLVQRVMRFDADGITGEALAVKVAELLGLRADVQIEIGHGDPPQGARNFRYYGEIGGVENGIVILNDSAASETWWRVTLPREGVSRGVAEAIAAVARALRIILRRDAAAGGCISQTPE